MEESDVLTERVSKAFQPRLLHAVVRQIGVERVIIEAVKIDIHSIVCRSEAGIGAVCRQDLVIAYAFQYVVKAAELLAAVGKIVLNGLTRESIEVRLVDVLFAGSKGPPKPSQREGCLE